MCKLSDFSVAALLQKVELLNPQNKFKIDNSFRIHISRTVKPSRSSNKRRNVHAEIDRKRFATSIVTISAGDDLFLPAALVLGKYRLTYDVAKTGANGMRWSNLIRKSRTKKLEWLAKQVVLECGLAIGRKFDLDDLKVI